MVLYNNMNNIHICACTHAHTHTHTHTPVAYQGNETSYKDTIKMPINV